MELNRCPAVGAPTTQELVRYLRDELPDVERKDVERYVALHKEYEEILIALKMLIEQYGEEAERMLLKSSLRMVNRIKQCEPETAYLKANTVHYNKMDSFKTAALVGCGCTTALVTSAINSNVAISIIYLSALYTAGGVLGYLQNFIDDLGERLFRSYVNGFRWSLGRLCNTFKELEFSSYSFRVGAFILNRLRNTPHYVMRIGLSQLKTRIPHKNQ